jgi:hypothetical protein
MSALPPKADMCGATCDVRFGPNSGHRPYSITSSALASKLAGMFKPSVLAVFRLIINSYLVFLPWPTMAYSRLKLAIQDHSQRR